ncbi:MAG: hypothetical protein ACNA7O_07820 [Rhodobacterales bacterium]
MQKIVPALIAAAVLAACEMPTQAPVVTAYNGDSVNIIQPAFTSASDAELLALANSICQRGSKKFAERVSMRQLPDFQGTEYLFLCLNRP